MSKVYAIQLRENDEWRLAEIAKASEYRSLLRLGHAHDTEVWSDHRTTAFLGLVGDEIKRIDLEEPNR